MRCIAIASLLLIACGGGSNTDDGTTDTDSTDDSADSDGMTDSTDGMDPDAPPLEGERHTLTITIPNVQPGEENTKCVWLRLDNAAEIKVHQIHNVLSLQSHHLIVYKDNQDTTEQTTPVDCEPFTGALNTAGNIAPFMITQKHDDTLTLPNAVGYTLQASQMVKLEMHYINSTEQAADAVAEVNFYAVDPGTIQHEADIIFTGSLDVSVPAMQETTLHQFFKVPNYLDLSASHIFAVTGHEHQYGTGVKVSVGPQGGALTEIYNPQNFNWAEPPTTNPPEFSVPAGQGFDFECKWNNTSNQDVDLGESANDEMCFFWLYYYPSQGSRVCAHTNRVGGQQGIDFCCPGNQTLCQYLEDNL